MLTPPYQEKKVSNVFSYLSKKNGAKPNVKYGHNDMGGIFQMKDFPTQNPSKMIAWPSLA